MSSMRQERVRELLKRAIAQRQRTISADFELPFGGSVLRVRPKDVLRVVREARKRTKRHNELCRAVEGELRPREGGFEPAARRQRAGAAIGARAQKIAKGDLSASFELTMARKDMRLMLEAAGDQPLVVLPPIAARMDEAIAAGHGKDDAAALASVVLSPSR